MWEACEVPDVRMNGQHLEPQFLPSLHLCIYLDSLSSNLAFLTNFILLLRQGLRITLPSVAMLPMRAMWMPMGRSATWVNLSDLYCRLGHPDPDAAEDHVWVHGSTAASICVSSKVTQKTVVRLQPVVLVSSRYVNTRASLTWVASACTQSQDVIWSQMAAESND